MSKEKAATVGADDHSGESNVGGPANYISTLQFTMPVKQLSKPQYKVLAAATPLPHLGRAINLEAEHGNYEDIHH